MLEIQCNNTGKFADENLLLETPFQVYKFLLNHWKDIRVIRSFKILQMNERGVLLLLINITGNNINLLAKDPQKILKIGIENRARFMIIAHNSDYGYLDKSIPTLSLKLINFSERYGLKIVDHILLNNNLGYQSMYENGFLDSTYKRKYLQDGKYPFA